MALEPITRQEQIIAGKDLEPITRMEKFLKEYGGGGGASSWNDLDDRPFGEVTTYGDTLTWDGNTSGMSAIGGIHYKVSDNVPTLEDFAGGFEFVVGGETANVPDNTGFTQITPTVLEFENGLFWIVSEDTDAGGGTIVAKGTYFFNDGEFAVTSLKIPNYTFAKTTLKQLDNKYLEPFETVGGDTLTWDGNTEGLESVSASELGGGDGFYYRISNATPTLDDFANGYSTTVEGSTNELTQDTVQDIGNGLLMVAEVFWIVPYDNFELTDEYGTISVEKKGFYNNPLNVSSFSLTINGYTGFTTTKLKEEYIPVDYIKQLIAEVTGN